MTSQPAKILRKVIQKLIPPKVVKRKRNVEGIEFEEMSLEEFE